MEEIEKEKIEIVVPEEEEIIAPRRKQYPVSSFFFDLASILATSVIVVAVSFMLLFRTVGIVGSSMYPTLHDSDRIILSAFIIQPKSGDIIVTCQPSKVDYIESTLVKRVIATEGQTVDIDFENGIVYVDGQALDEPYVNEAVHDVESFSGPLKVPEDYVFVMGDNRNASTDSRDERVGLIREDYIMGKAIFRIQPFGQFKIG
ncbi:MAG: signal peptidase I [Clostridiales bacterium]|nr:signal peptidase I [Clostridiales bacterium]